MREAIDFRNSNGDTDYPEPASILPVSDGEPASQLILRRPTENVRSRSEILREYLQEHMLLQEMTPMLYTALPGATPVSFAGVYPANTGIFTIPIDLVVMHMSTPGTSVAFPFIQSTQARLAVGTFASNELVFTSVNKQYQGSTFPVADPNGIAVEIVAGSSLTVTTNGATGNKNHIYITIVSGTTTCTDVINAVTASAPANTLVTVTLGAGSTGTNPAPLWGPPQWAGDYSLRFLKGGCPAVLHTISPANLALFFTDVNNRIMEGDTIGIYYDKTVDKTSTGGRLQSTPENINYSLGPGSLFNSRREPWKLPNSIPICKCVTPSTLLFADGSFIEAGFPAALGSPDSLFMQNVVWGLVDATTWGWVKINTGSHAPPANVKETFDNIDAYINGLSGHVGVFVSVTDGTTSTGGMFNSPNGITQALTALAASGGTVLVRSGNYTVSSAIAINATVRLMAVEPSVNITFTAGVGAFNVGVGAPYCVFDGLTLITSDNHPVFTSSGAYCRMVRCNSIGGLYTLINESTVDTCNFNDGGVAFSGAIVILDSGSKIVNSTLVCTTCGALMALTRCQVLNVTISVATSGSALQLGAFSHVEDVSITATFGTRSSTIVTLGLGTDQILKNLTVTATDTGTIQACLFDFSAVQAALENILILGNNTTIGTFASSLVKFIGSNLNIKGFRLAQFKLGYNTTNHGYQYPVITAYNNGAVSGSVVKIDGLVITALSHDAVPSGNMDVALFGDVRASATPNDTGLHVGQGGVHLVDCTFDVSGKRYNALGTSYVLTALPNNSIIERCTFNLGTNGAWGNIVDNQAGKNTRYLHNKIIASGTNPRMSNAFYIMPYAASVCDNVILDGNIIRSRSETITGLAITIGAVALSVVAPIVINNQVQHFNAGAGSSINMNGVGGVCRSNITSLNITYGAGAFGMLPAAGALGTENLLNQGTYVE